MTVRDLIDEVEKRYMQMPSRARIAAIKRLAAESPGDARFLRRTFPKLYDEAFRPKRSAGKKLAKRAGLR